MDWGYDQEHSFVFFFKMYFGKKERLINASDEG